MRIDLNADLGEGMGDDAAMLDVVTSANVACGGHAGDKASMLAVCAAAVERGVRIGAHVSYPDRAEFGRADMEIGGEALLDVLRNQLAALTTAALAAGGEVAFVKPHGALYHRASHDPEHAQAVVTLAREAGIGVVGLPGGLSLTLAETAGLTVTPEAFADRGYRQDGSLVPRSEPGAVLHDPAVVAARMVALVRSGTIATAEGVAVGVTARSICVHSDTPGAVAIARAVREGLVAAGVEIVAAT